jgi:hypothetical protein
MSDLSSFIIKPYQGRNNTVKKITELVVQKYADMFYAVILHGSLATSDEIPYSDFDGLIILKDGYSNSKKLKRFITESLSIIYKFDPLQHHGWFLIQQSDLNRFPESYFPSTIFNYSRCLFPAKGITLQISLNEAYDFVTPLVSVLTSLKKKLTINRPANIYKLKSLLSEFMLIPALYLQAKNKRGVYKKDSFEIARVDFTKGEWEIMDRISSIRSKWNYKLPIISRLLMYVPDKRIRKITGKLLLPGFTKEYKKIVDDRLFSSMHNFVIEVERKVNGISE